MRSGLGGARPRDPPLGRARGAATRPSPGPRCRRRSSSSETSSSHTRRTRRRSTAPGAGLVTSWVTNNVWETNFPLAQGGEVRFDYAVASAGPGADARALGIATADALTRPLVGVLGATAPRRAGTVCELDAPGVEVVMLGARTAASRAPAVVCRRRGRRAPAGVRGAHRSRRLRRRADQHGPASSIRADPHAELARAVGKLEQACRLWPLASSRSKRHAMSRGSHGAETTRAFVLIDIAPSVRALRQPRGHDRPTRTGSGRTRTSGSRPARSTCGRRLLRRGRSSHR